MNHKINGIIVIMVLLLSMIPSIYAVKDPEQSKNSKQMCSLGKEITPLNQPPTIEWNNTYGSQHYEMLYFVTQTSDNGYIASGYTEDEEGLDGWILKLDTNGNEMWREILPGDSSDGNLMINFVVETSDGYLACGEKGESTSWWYSDGILWKINKNGETEWIKNYDYGVNAFGNFGCIQETKDGNFILAGITAGTSINDGEALLLKVDPTGEPLWKKRFGRGEGFDYFRSVQVLDNGDYLAAGTSTLDSNSDMFLVKTDENGNLLCEKTIGGEKSDACMSRNCFCCEDGGFLLNGITSSYGCGRDDLCVIKTDANGELQWMDTYGEKTMESCWSMESMDDGGFVFCAVLNYNGIMNNRGELWVIRCDDQGNVLWSETFGGKREDRGYYVSKTNDGGLILAGRTESFGSGDSDGWLIKLGPEGAVEQPTLQLKRPREGWIYIWDMIGIPFPFIDHALIYSYLTFNVNAEDTLGISKVEFFIDDCLAYTDQEAPYEYKWVADPGTYTFKARAYNMIGGTTKELVELIKKS